MAMYCYMLYQMPCLEQWHWVILGSIFPDTDDAYQGADSKVLLKHVYALVQAKGYTLGNADMTVICELPKLSPHNLAMRECIAGVLGVSVDCVSIKATTNEKKWAG